MIYVFYAGQLINECEGEIAFGAYRVKCGQEIYNGGYFYCTHVRPNVVRWYRMDSTPVLDADVPPELKTLVLLLT